MDPMTHHDHMQMADQHVNHGQATPFLHFQAQLCLYRFSERLFSFTVALFFSVEGG